jgi:hypothetical protein
MQEQQQRGSRRYDCGYLHAPISHRCCDACRDCIDGECACESSGCVEHESRGCTRGGKTRWSTKNLPDRR